MPHRCRLPSFARCVASARATVVLALAYTTVPMLALGAQTSLPAAPSDSIVNLAINPAQHRGRPFVMLLDEAHVRVEPDGRTITRTRQVFQILDQTVVAGFSERAFNYVKSHQTLTVDWIRVLKPSGIVVSNKPAQEQESDVAAQMANPVYQEQKIRRVSLSGVAVGTILDIQFTTEERVPPRAGDFMLRWTMNNQYAIARSRFTVDVPEAYTPRIVERNLTARRSEVAVGGRRRYIWTASEVPPYRAERYASDSNGVLMSILVTSPSTWSDIAKWYDGLARERYTLTPAVAQRVDSLVNASAPRTRLDTIRAVHRWVAQDLRYVSVSLGIGGYQPRLPADVIATGFGDCKDKATLFVAALRRYKMAANPVLLALNSKPDPALPSIYQFNHAIAAVQEGNGWTFTDLTAEYVPYGNIPENYQGQFGIVVLPDGRAQEVRFPTLPIDSSSSVVRIALTLDTSGRAEGRVSEEVRGNASVPARAAFSVPLDSTRRKGVAASMAQRLFASDASVDSLVAFNGRDLTAPTVVSYHVKADRAIKRVGDTRLFTMNAAFKGPALTYKNIARELEARQPRLFPIDAAQVLGTVEQVVDLRITLPVGWTAELPKNVLATSFFGRYESTWTQEGREIRLVRRIKGQRGVFPPQRISELIVWLKTVGADDYEFLSLKPSQGN